MNADILQPVLLCFLHHHICVLRWDNLHTYLLAASLLSICFTNKKFQYKMVYGFVQLQASAAGGPDTTGTLNALLHPMCRLTQNSGAKEKEERMRST